jgi:hypothetical protein
MFKDKDVAVAIKEAMQNVNLLLLRSYVKVLDGHGDMAEKREYKKRVALIQTLIAKEVLNPICNFHPDLEEQERYSVEEEE